MSDQDLHLKYRPTQLSDVIGHQSVVRSLQAFSKSQTFPHAYLFCGPSGVGKTTLARILARELFKCDENNILEVDAATYSKVEGTRELIRSLNYVPLGGGNRVVILDEVHALSTQSWQVLLKTIEEPPHGTAFIFCTTEFDKVPATIKSRCHVYTLGALKRDDLIDLLNTVTKGEGFRWATPEIISTIAAESDGSPRRALVGLSMCRGLKNPQEVREVLRSFDGETESGVIDLCRLLVKQPQDPMKVWARAVKIVETMETDSYEGARLAAVAYFAKTLIGSPTEQTAWRLHVLDCFCAKMYNYNHRKADLLLTIGNILLEGDQ